MLSESDVSELEMECSESEEWAARSGSSSESTMVRLARRAVRGLRPLGVVDLEDVFGAVDIRSVEWLRFI